NIDYEIFKSFGDLERLFSKLKSGNGKIKDLFNFVDKIQIVCKFFSINSGYGEDKESEFKNGDGFYNGDEDNIVECGFYNGDGFNNGVGEDNIVEYGFNKGVECGFKKGEKYNLSTDNKCDIKNEINNKMEYDGNLFNEDMSKKIKYNSSEINNYGEDCLNTTNNKECLNNGNCPNNTINHTNNHTINHTNNHTISNTSNHISSNTFNHSNNNSINYSFNHSSNNTFNNSNNNTINHSNNTTSIKFNYYNNQISKFLQKFTNLYTITRETISQKKKRT
ncbi:hypothetical protein NAPIS_ORF00338, partial [Vairimorpha apis BRL 01]